MYRQMTLDLTPSAISSPASASGPTPCASPAGPTTGPSGQAPAPASPLALQVQDAALQTNGTSGPSGSISFASAALQSSLESRLKRRLGTAGLTLFKLTWKASTTPAGRSVCLLRASAPRTTARDFGSWPTPNANEDAAGSLRGNMQWMLTHAAKLRDPQGTAAGKQLNSALACWLMGLPAVWEDCAPTATPSSRKSRKRS